MKCVDVVIETPKGSAQKYDFDPLSKFFELKKILPAGMVFPYDFGFIPATKGQDGDPLDIIVISEFKSFPGCKMKCRVIGGMKAEQTKDKNNHKEKMIRNDRFITIPDCSSIFQNIRSIKELPDQIINELEAFFTEYNRLEGKRFTVLKKLDAKEALSIINRE